MAITREQKEAQVAALASELQNSQLSVLTAYNGLSVSQAQELRAQMKKSGGNFRVIKNAMFKRAAEQVYADLDVSDLTGPIAIAFGYEDQVMPAKVVVDYAKNTGVLEPIAAINDQGERFNAEEVQRLASLPSREQLTAQLVGTIAAPLSGLVGVLQGNLRGLVTVLDGIAQAKEA